MKINKNDISLIRDRKIPVPSVMEQKWGHAPLYGVWQEIIEDGEDQNSTASYTNYAKAFEKFNEAEEVLHRNTIEEFETKKARLKSLEVLQKERDEELSKIAKKCVDEVAKVKNEYLAATEARHSKYDESSQELANIRDEGVQKANQRYDEVKKQFDQEFISIQDKLYGARGVAHNEFNEESKTIRAKARDMILTQYGKDSHIRELEQRDIEISAAKHAKAIFDANKTYKTAIEGFNNRKIEMLEHAKKEFDDAVEIANGTYGIRKMWKDGAHKHDISRLEQEKNEKIVKVTEENFVESEIVKCKYDEAEAKKAEGWNHFLSQFTYGVKYANGLLQEAESALKEAANQHNTALKTYLDGLKNHKHPFQNEEMIDQHANPVEEQKDQDEGVALNMGGNTQVPANHNIQDHAQQEVAHNNVLENIGEVGDLFNN